MTTRPTSSATWTMNGTGRVPQNQHVKEINKYKYTNIYKYTNVKESNKRMVFLHKLSRFTKKQDLKKIYILQIRSKLEQSSVLWHRSITKKSEYNLERVQKLVLKIILEESYVRYDNALKVLKLQWLQSLKERRGDLCLKFAKKCLEVPKLNRMFTRSQQNHSMGKRSTETFQGKRGLTERMSRSAIPHMQRLLNEDGREKRDICRKISNYKPVNNKFVCKSVSVRK